MPRLNCALIFELLYPPLRDRLKSYKLLHLHWDVVLCHTLLCGGGYSHSSLRADLSPQNCPVVSGQLECFLASS